MESENNENPDAPPEEVPAPIVDEGAPLEEMTEPPSEPAQGSPEEGSPAHEQADTAPADSEELPLEEIPPDEAEGTPAEGSPEHNPLSEGEPAPQETEGSPTHFESEPAPEEASPGAVESNRESEPAASSQLEAEGEPAQAWPESSAPSAGETVPPSGGESGPVSPQREPRTEGRSPSPLEEGALAPEVEVAETTEMAGQTTERGDEGEGEEALAEGVSSSRPEESDAVSQEPGESVVVSQREPPESGEVSQRELAADSAEPAPAPEGEIEAPPRTPAAPPETAVPPEEAGQFPIPETPAPQPAAASSPEKAKSPPPAPPAPLGPSPTLGMPRAKEGPPVKSVVIADPVNGESFPSPVARFDQLHKVSKSLARQPSAHGNELIVRVPMPDGSERTVRVSIERQELPKLNWGGYRHKRTGIEYYHAAVQTNPRVRPPHPVPRFSRDAQTVHVKQIVQQTNADHATQMTGIGLYVSNAKDRLLAPKPYITADEHHQQRLDKAIVIQRWVRRWLAQRYVARLRAEKKARSDWMRQEEEAKAREREARLRKEYERRMKPRSKEDFDLLYHHLEQWRTEELARIDGEFEGDEQAAQRKAALCQLLDDETALLSGIERQKIDASQQWKHDQVKHLLENSSAPKVWVGRDGKPTAMETPFTLRAKQLRELYECIQMHYVTRDERLDVLLTLKHTVAEHECALTREIASLADREADLILRGFDLEKLEGLRKRIASLFLQYIKTPTFNPEVSRLLRVPQDPLQLKRDIYFCLSCARYLPSTAFALSTLSKATGRCRECLQLDNRARARHDYTNYRYMLRTLRTREEKMADGAKVAFILQESDIRYLVEQIWGGKSILSSAGDPHDLVLVRWDVRDEWSPWNTLLLTKDEVPAHERVDRLHETYCAEFLQKVRRLHTLAKNYFSRLPALAEHVTLKERFGVRPSLGLKGRGSSGGKASARGTATECIPDAEENALQLATVVHGNLNELMDDILQ